MGIVYRPEFENHLRLHFQNLVSSEDVASYALRNAVYAVGCRAAALMDGNRDLNEVQRISSELFFNALSVYTDLIFMPSGLKAVQALIVMVSPSTHLSTTWCWVLNSPRRPLRNYWEVQR